MAKQVEIIQRFDGGLNNRDSQKDLTEGFLSDATNVDVSHIGTIKSVGKFVSDGFDNTIDLTPASFQTGVGLFTFRTDVGADSNDSAGEYIAYADGDGGILFGSDVSRNTFNHQFNSSGHIDSADLGSDSNAKPVFYYADGGLRVADSDLSHTNNTPLALIPIVRSGDIYGTINSGYYTSTFTLDPPVSGDFDALSSADDPDDDETELTVATDNICDIAVSANTAAGSQPTGLWAEGAYVVGISYVYYGGQESKVSDFLGHVDVGDGQYLLASVAVKDGGLGASSGASNQGEGKFIQGLRVYVKDFNEPEDEFTLLLDLDFERGSRISLGNEFDPLVETTGEFHTHDPLNGQASTSTGGAAYAIFSPSTTTYSNINGYDMEEQEISFQNTAYGYKTAVVANQRTFVANVRYPDTDGKIRNMGDRIQYTPTRKYDTFPQTYYLEVGGNDGDEIIKLEEYQDRLFIFKKNKLFILDISSPSDFEWRIIGEFNNRGVSNPGAVSKSDAGIVWVNEYGLFGFSDGIQKLSLAINDDTWATNIDADNVQVGYIPKRNQILIIGTAATTSSVGYLYDMITSSFVNLTVNNSLLGSTVTNFVRFEQELCIMGSNGTLSKFDTTAAANRVVMKTKEFDFNLPSVDKKIYSIYVTYKDGNNVSLKYALNGAALDNSNGLATIDREGTSSNALSNSSTRATHKFTFESSTTCKSIQLLFTSGTNDAETGFEVEDITITYRARPPK